jgi:competence protein ComGC
MLNIVGTKELSPVNLKQFQQQLLQIYPQGYPLMNMEGERLCFMDAVQHVFTEGGPGGGHLVPRGYQYLEGDISGDREHMPMFLCTAASMVQAGRDKTIDKGNEIYDRLEKHAKMSPYERRISDPNGIDAMISALPKYRFFLLQMLMPAVDRASEMAYRGKALHEATVTVLALKQWRLEKNEYPTNLDELVAAGYLKHLPMDPYTERPLIYRKADGNFTLYSIGPNFKDDGGQVYRDKKGKVKLWGDEGDAVFWPVPKSEVKQ